MADEKQTIVDLRRAIAHQTGMTEAMVARFLSALIPEIISGIQTDRLVRISGLGAFRLVTTEPRKSVNVSTGESIIIEGYNKITFSPDNDLRDRVNQPFAHLQPIVVDADGHPIVEQPARTNPLDKLDAEANAIKDLLADINGLEPIPAEEPKPVVEEPVALPVEPVSEEPVLEEPVQPEPVPVVEEHHFRPWRVALCTILFFALALVGGYFYLENRIEEWAKTLNGGETTEQVWERQYQERIQAESATAAQPVEAPVDEAIVEKATAEEATMTETIAEPTAPAAKPATPSVPATKPATSAPAVKQTPVVAGERTYTEFIATEEIQPGSRLARIAQRHYGHRELWVYIYEANQDFIKDPSNVPVGRTIRIPKLPAELSDLSRPEAKSLADELQKKYLAR